MSNLNDDQLAIIVHLANGLRPTEIAKEMHWSASVVNKHIASARKALGARTVAHMCCIAIEFGILVSDRNE